MFRRWKKILKLNFELQNAHNVISLAGTDFPAAGTDFPAAGTDFPAAGTDFPAADVGSIVTIEP